jgi:hypothetical protein
VHGHAVHRLLEPLSDGYARLLLRRFTLAAEGPWWHLAVWMPQ